VRLLGTGAMACWLGGLLAREGGAAVTLAGTWPEALLRLEREGVDWRGDETSFRATVDARRIDGDLPAADLSVVLVKAHQTARVAAQAFRALSPGAPVLSLQNGLGAREALLTDAPGQAARVALGVATVGARLRAPGVVEVSGHARVVIERRPLVAPALEALAERLRAAGVEAVCVDDIAPHVWRKLVANCAVNALTALHGVTNGALLEREDLRPEFEAAAREAGAVARTLGIELGAEPVELARAVAAATARNRSSMLQDVERGRPTEIDAINGMVVTEGDRLGVATPVNRVLWGLVRSAGRGAQGEAG
jgi:2-dehydropantoate 2-reductase